MDRYTWSKVPDPKRRRNKNVRPSKYFTPYESTKFDWKRELLFALLCWAGGIGFGVAVVLGFGLEQIKAEPFVFFLIATPSIFFVIPLLLLLPFWRVYQHKRLELIADGALQVKKQKTYPALRARVELYSPLFFGVFFHVLWVISDAIRASTWGEPVSFALFGSWQFSASAALHEWGTILAVLGLLSFFAMLAAVFFSVRRVGLLIRDERMKKAIETSEPNALEHT